MGSEKVIQGCNRPAPGQLIGAGEPFGVLVGHRIDDVHKRFITAEQAVPTGQQVALQPALTQMLGEHLHHPAARGQMFVVGGLFCLPCLVGRIEDRGEPVGRRLVGAHQPEVVTVAADHVPQVGAQHPGRLAHAHRGVLHLHRVVGDRGQIELTQQQPTVGMRVGAHPPVTVGCQRLQVRAQRPGLVEQLLGPVAAHPGLESLQMVGVGAGLRQRHLMRSPGALDLLSVHLAGAGPALRGAQDDHRPQWSAHLPVHPRCPLNGRDLVERVIECAGQLPVHVDRIVTGDGDRHVAVAAHQRIQFVGRDAGQHRRVGDLVAVEVQDRQHRPVAHRVEEFVGMPARRQRTGFGLTVADDRGHHQVRIVECGAVGVHQGVPEFAALVDRAGCLRRRMAGDAAGERELAEQLLQPVGVLADTGVHLGVGALQVGVGHHARPAVARAGDVDDVGIALSDHPVEVRVEQVEARCGAPVAEQPRFDVLGRQGLAQQRVVQQVDLPHGQVIGGPPVGVEQGDLGVGDRCQRCRSSHAQRFTHYPVAEHAPGGRPRSRRSTARWPGRRRTSRCVRR